MKNIDDEEKIQGKNISSSIKLPILKSRKRKFAESNVDKDVVKPEIG